MDFDKFQKSLKHLELQYQNYQNLEERSELDTLDQEAIKESVIQRFETCYDTLWKHLKRYLTEELGLAEVPNSLYVSILRDALTAGLPGSRQSLRRFRASSYSEREVSRRHIDDWLDPRQAAWRGAVRGMPPCVGGDRYRRHATHSRPRPYWRRPRKLVGVPQRSSPQRGRPPHHQRCIPCWLAMLDRWAERVESAGTGR